MFGKKMAKLSLILLVGVKVLLFFQNSYLDRDNTLAEVKVSDISGGTNASGRITLNTTNPKILFYENDPNFRCKMGNSFKQRIYNK